MLILAKAYMTDYHTEDSTRLCVVYSNSSRSFKLYMCTYAMLLLLLMLALFSVFCVCGEIEEKKAWYTLTAHAQFPQGFLELI